MTIVETTVETTPNYPLYSPISCDVSPKMEINQLSELSTTLGSNGPLRYATNGFKNVEKVSPKSNGPDECAPAEHIWSSEPHIPVKLRLGRNPKTDGIKPISVPTWFKNIVDEHANMPAMRVKRDGRWITWTYNQYYQDVRNAAKAFVYLGLEPFHSVGIIGFNAPEWFIADIGAIFAGGLAVGIYTTNSAEACQYNASDSRANILVVEDDKQLQKILKIRSQLPLLKAIIQYTGQPTVGREQNVYSWEEFMQLSKYVPDVVLEERHKLIAPNKCCTIIYTSGTTGNPKGAMLSHDNLIWTALSAMAGAKLFPGGEQEVFVSYLPLSHVAAQMTDLYLCVCSAGVVYFAQSDALKGTLVETMKEARPTCLIGVPRVWEKMAEKMQNSMKKNGTIKTWVGSLAQDVGLRGTLRQMTGYSVPFGWSLAKNFVFSRARNALGLDRCRFTCSGAAPLAKDVQEFFLSFNIPIYDIYGMSESSAPHTVNLPGAYKLGSAGKELDGVQTKIEKPDRDGNGEVCMYGRHVFMGYLGLEEKTKEVIDSEGFLHTGDIGKIDSDGFLFITGRLKELLITAGGENIPPIPIENIIKEELPVISNAMLIGDKRKFLSVLLTLKSEINLTTGEPLDKLTRIARDWIKDNCQAEVATVSEALRLSNLEKAIEKGLIGVNKKATSRAQCVQKFKVLSADFTIPGGELGPTLKLKRPVVHQKYSDIIEGFYQEGGES